MFEIEHFLRQIVQSISWFQVFQFPAINIELKKQFNYSINFKNGFNLAIINELIDFKFKQS